MSRTSCLVILLVAVVAGQALGKLSRIELADLKAGSALVVVGTAVQVDRIKFAPEPGRIETRVTVSVEQTLKGSPGGSQVVVRTSGGRVGDEAVMASEEARFATGQRVILFLNPASSAFRVFGKAGGKFTVVAGTVRETGIPEAEFIQQINALP